jgi:hypothetical protein
MVIWVLNMQKASLSMTLQELKLHLAEELEVSKARGLTSHACHTFYYNLENMYTQHTYQSNHIWNSYETNVQVWQ